MGFESPSAFPRSPERGRSKEANELEKGDYLPAYDAEVERTHYGGGQETVIVLNNGTEVRVDSDEEFEVK